MEAFKQVSSAAIALPDIAISAVNAAPVINLVNFIFIPPTFFFYLTRPISRSSNKRQRLQHAPRSKLRDRHNPYEPG